MRELLHWFAHPWAFALLVTLPVLAGFGVLAAIRRRRSLVRLGSLAALRSLTPVRGGLRVLRTLLFVNGLTFLILGIAGPQWGRDWGQSTAPGRDVVVVLDLSRSMLAQDVVPSRVEKARQAIADLSYTVQKRGGHRLALVVFAGRAKLVCPLTHDYDHFRYALAELDPTSLPADLRPDGKESLSGTRIGAGLREAVTAQDPRFRGFQDIILISDGDDPAQDGEWREGRDEARRLKIPVHTVGVGDPAADSPIPDYAARRARPRPDDSDAAPPPTLKEDAMFQHNNQIVRTRLQEQPLEAIAQSTGGTYTPARTSDLPLGELFLERIEPGETHEDSEDAVSVYQQHYTWFFSVALLLLGLEMTLGQRRPRPAVRFRRAAA
jgi:Ca-activated chloride channel family protein